MSKTIKIQIIHSLAINSAKNETYQKGVIDKAVDQKLVVAAYHSQAGNEAYHETMLRRSMLTQIEVLKTLFHNYLTGDGNLAEDATIDSSEADDVTEIVLNVSDRFNNGYTKTLARLGQKFVEDRMIHLWWVPVSKEFAALYAQCAAEDQEGIQSCFYKTAPTAPVYKYPTKIYLSYPLLPDNAGVPGWHNPDNSKNIEPEMLFKNPFLISTGMQSEISYTLEGENGAKPMDDIVVRADDPCVAPAILPNGGWSFRGMCSGLSIVTLYSRHNDQVFAKFAVRVV